MPKCRVRGRLTGRRKSEARGRGKAEGHRSSIARPGGHGPSEFWSCKSESDPVISMNARRRKARRLRPHYLPVVADAAGVNRCCGISNHDDDERCGCRTALLSWPRQVVVMSIRDGDQHPRRRPPESQYTTEATIHDGGLTAINHLRQPSSPGLQSRIGVNKFSDMKRTPRRLHNYEGEKEPNSTVP